jgi:hypothetical protein
VFQVQGSGAGGRPGGGSQKPTFALLNQEPGALSTTIDSSDSEPTSAEETAYENSYRGFSTAVASWNDLVKGDLVALNAKLANQDLAALPAAEIAVPPELK